VIDKHKVNQFYTAPTAIRSLMAAGLDDCPRAHDRSSLRVLGSVGEPINEEAWHWYHDPRWARTVAQWWTPGGRRRPAAS
jgi:acetyl-CoA synthetase